MNGRARKTMLAVSTRRSKTMQNVSTLVRRPVRIGTAAASGLLAFVAGAVIAVSAPAVVATLCQPRLERHGVGAGYRLRADRSQPVGGGARCLVVDRGGADRSQPLGSRFG